MPVYEYACRQCGARFERLVRLSESDRVPECPECGGRTVGKLFSTFAAFSNGSDGAARPIAGGCACAAGGACGCG